MRRPLTLLLAPVILLIALTSCSRRSPDPNASGAPGTPTDPVRVVATTGMVGDLARQIGGDRIALTALMGPGVDPHLYKATASDVTALQRAAVVLYSGLHLEGRMTELLEQMNSASRRVVAVTSALPPERLRPTDDAGKSHDPHVWFDVALWAECTGPVAEALASADPAHAAAYRERAAATRARLLELHDWVQQTLAQIPAERRILVTSHDAFGYFGAAYGFEVIGLQGISTVTEAGLADMAKLSDFIRDRKVPALFVESSVSHATLERISADTGVRIGGELFSDAMGSPGQMEEGYDIGTYEGMIRHNVNALLKALR